MAYNRFVEPLKKIVIEAGNIILDVYKTDFGKSIEKKSDESPVTKADKLANDYIVNQLKLLDSEIPIIAEESKQIEYSTRKDYDLFWLVDPLDGTKEFIKKNDEFTVNIALVKGEYPVVGIVFAPVFDEMYYGIEGKGAFKEQKGKKFSINCKKTDLEKENLKFLISRSHISKSDKKYLESFKSPIVQNMGSSLKFMRIAEGKADVYFRYTPTMEWDTAASQIIIEESGAIMFDIVTEERLKYNKQSLVNPGFVAHGKLK